MSEQQQEYGGIIINGIDCSGGGGSSVTPNPPAPATETLSSLDINGVVYGIEQETRENIFSIFDTFNLNDDCSSGQLVAGDHFTFGINDARNDWSGSTTIYNNNAYDLTDIDKLELVVEVTQQSDYAYLWLTFSNTKYTWGTSSWPGVYQNKTSALQISQSGNYEVDVSELTGNYYIYIGATSGKDDITPGDCNNTHNGVIAGTVTEFNIISSSMGTSVIPNPDGSATEVLKKIKIDEDIYKVADVEEVTEEQYTALPSTKNSDDTVYMVKHIEDIFDGSSTISLLGGNGITLESSSVTGKIGTLSAYEYSAGYEGFNIALQNLTVGQTYKLEFDFQFTSAQFIGNNYRCAYLISATQKTNYTDYTQWTENLPRDLVKHHHSVQFTASATTMYVAFNLCGCSDNVNNYFTINNIYVINTIAQNKIILNGNQYGTGSSGGTEVIANPTGTATADLNKISIGGIIYNITGGGSGGGSNFESTTLYTGTQRETTINLSDDYTNYDYLVLQGCAPTEDGYLKSELVSVDDIVQGNYIGVSDDIAYLWYVTTNSTTLTYKSASGGYYIKAIYGLKESEGGSGGYLTLVPCYAEFIEGFNNTYWNTHLGQLNAEYFLDFYIDQYQNDRSILGSSGGSGRLHLTMYGNKWYTSTGNGETSFGDSTMITGRHTFRWNTVSDSKILFDEQDTGITCSQSEVKDINIYINNRSTRSINDTCTNSRMYEFKITAKNGTVLHDFKPYALYAGSTLIWKGVMDVVGGMEADGWFNVKEIPGGGTILVGADIEPNSEEEPTEILDNIKIDDTVYSVGGGGSDVEANPSDPATDTLNTIGIDGTVYDIAGGGGGGSSSGVYIEETLYTAPSNSFVDITVDWGWKDYDLYIFRVHDTYSENGDTTILTKGQISSMVSSGNHQYFFRFGSSNCSYVFTSSQLTARANANGLFIEQIIGIKVSGDYYSPVIYSTEEREIGVWTDNKPLYQKTFNGSWTLSGSSWSNTIVTIANAELKDVRCLDTDWQSMGVNGNIDSSGNLTLYNLRGTTLTARAVTVWYTKTTDTAGSGSYNTLGVPTVHYTTDEQVIGTWFDGRPIYQKVWDNLNINVTANNWTNTITITDGIDVVDCKAWGAFGNDYFLIVPTQAHIQSDNGGLLEIWAPRNRTVLRMMVQYTKTTD